MTQLYLSRLFLNPRNAQARQECTQPYELHRTLLRAFPDQPVHLPRLAGEGPGLLFRLEESDDLLRILAQSQTVPRWDFLASNIDGRGYPYLIPSGQEDDTGSNPAVRPFDLDGRLAIGQILGFRLRANPTVKKDRPGQKQGRRVGLDNEDAQLGWLRHKGEQGGFRILEARLRKEGHLKDERRGLEFLSVQFDGLLQVLDPVRLTETIINGVGSAKAFGFGLLSLASANAPG